MDSLLAWRKEFPILDRTTYMISHSLGAMPRRAAGRLREFSDTWASRGIRAWEEGWWEMPITVGNLVGSIIGAGEGEVVMQQNVSICQSIVTSCFDWSGRRNKLVTDGLNFPSNDYVYHGLARVGARVESVPSPDSLTLPVELLLKAIDDETQLVSVSHVAFRSSYLQDLAAIVERAHAVGAMVIADLYQSAGTVPVNVRELQLDFATGGSVKWLCGGPGSGVPVRAARPLEQAEPYCYGMDGAPRAVRVRGRADPVRWRRLPLSQRYTERSGFVFGQVGLRNHP